MSIQSTDLVLKYSTPQGTQGNQLPQLAPNNSLGGFISTTTWFGSVIDDLFDDISGSANRNMQVDYRCIFIQNNHATLTLMNTRAYISAQTPGTGNAIPSIGADPIGVTPNYYDGLQAVVVPNTFIAPSEVVFSEPIGYFDGVSIGNIPPSYCAAIWIRRIAMNGVAQTKSGFSLTVLGDSM